MTRNDVLVKAAEMEFQGTCVHGELAHDPCGDCQRAEEDLSDDLDGGHDRFEGEKSLEAFLVAAAQREEGKAYSLADLEAIWAAPLC